MWNNWPDQYIYYVLRQAWIWQWWKTLALTHFPMHDIFCKKFWKSDPIDFKVGKIQISENLSFFYFNWEYGQYHWPLCLIKLQFHQTLHIVFLYHRSLKTKETLLVSIVLFSQHMSHKSGKNWIVLFHACGHQVGRFCQALRSVFQTEYDLCKFSQHFQSFTQNTHMYVVNL